MADLSWFGISCISKGENLRTAVAWDMVPHDQSLLQTLLARHAEYQPFIHFEDGALINNTSDLRDGAPSPELPADLAVVAPSCASQTDIGDLPQPGLWEGRNGAGPGGEPDCSALQLTARGGYL
jgi:hypothetical protein